MQYGSMTNLLESLAAVTPIAVGVGATELCWSDRHPYTVIEVSPTGKRAKIQADEATRTDHNGMSESQEYTFTPDPNGVVREIRLGKDGKWHITGSPRQHVLIGTRQKYYDFGF